MTLENDMLAVTVDNGEEQLYRSFGKMHNWPQQSDEFVFEYGRNVHYVFANGTVWAAVSGSLTNNQGANTSFSSFLVTYGSDNRITSVSLGDKHGWDVVQSTTTAPAGKTVLSDDAAHS